MLRIGNCGGAVELEDEVNVTRGDRARSSASFLQSQWNPGIRSSSGEGMGLDASFRRSLVCHFVEDTF
eukprot:scaffold890_cov269-Pinguiococcus_pyrenoidosus.AAC.5